MAKALCVYDTATSAIKGFLRFGADADADVYPLDPATESALEISVNHAVFGNQAQWKISNGQLVQKNIVTLTASAPTFPADGVSAVEITFANLSAATSLDVAGQQVTVSPADSVLTLTVDAPQVITMQVNDADQWSNPVTVEAV